MGLVRVLLQVGHIGHCSSPVESKGSHFGHSVGNWWTVRGHILVTAVHP